MKTVLLESFNAAAGLVLILALIFGAALISHAYAPHVRAEIAQAPVCVGDGPRLHCE